VRKLLGEDRLVESDELGAGIQTELIQQQAAQVLVAL
jgi:hypothetical protein